MPSYGYRNAGEWFWYRWKITASPAEAIFMDANYRPDFQYADFAPQFTAEFYNSNAWADLFKVNISLSSLFFYPKTDLSILLFFLNIVF